MKGGILVRPATPLDEAPVTRLYQASYPALMRDYYSPDVLSAALPLMTRANPTLLASSRFYVAMADDQTLIGCGGWSLERPGTGQVEARLGHIRHFATHPQFLMRGVGRAIFDACALDARKAACSALECFSSLNGEAFYTALGFRRISLLDVDMGAGVRFPSALMVRNLD